MMVAVQLFSQQHGPRFGIFSDIDGIRMVEMFFSRLYISAKSEWNFLKQRIDMSVGQGLLLQNTRDFLETMEVAQVFRGEVARMLVKTPPSIKIRAVMLEALNEVHYFT